MRHAHNQSCHIRTHMLCRRQAAAGLSGAKQRGSCTLRGGVRVTTKGRKKARAKNKAGRDPTQVDSTRPWTACSAFRLFQQKHVSASNMLVGEGSVLELSRGAVLEGKLMYCDGFICVRSVQKNLGLSDRVTKSITAIIPRSHE